MKTLFIGIASLVFILILYDLYGKKNSTHILRQKTGKYNTGSNHSELEKPDIGIVKEINSEHYDRFILTKTTTERYLLSALKEYGELSGNEAFNIYNFGIAEEGDWKIIKVEASISFYVYHNLVGWFNGYEEYAENPKQSIGFAKNKTNSQEDYLFFLNPENQFGDTQIGAFRNGAAFSIYLPEAYEKYGNLTLKNELVVSMKEHLDFISKEGLDCNRLPSLHYKMHKIKMHE